MITPQQRNYLELCRRRYRDELSRNILPFWLEHGLDRVNGGVYTCFDREGRLMDSTKSVWFQGRCGFVFALAYNMFERRPEYLEMSRSCLDFIERHCIDTDGRIYFEVTADGTPLRKRRYVFSECFAAIAMAEYAVATSDPAYTRKACDMLEVISRYIGTPGLLEPKYMDTLPAIGHSITMIMINTASRVRRALQAVPVEGAEERIADIDARIAESVELLRTKFMHPEFKAVLEMVSPDGKLIDTLNGRVINPGHCIETAWFLLDEAAHRGGDRELADMALTIFDWSWDWGWDPQYGGIINFRDCRNFPPQDYSQDMKFWWPQTEAVIATLHAYLASGRDEYLEKHRLANDWMLEHLVDPDYPEWYGYLHRDGTVAQPAKGNIFKGPFHIPRMLLLASDLIDRILEQ